MNPTPTLTNPLSGSDIHIPDPSESHGIEWPAVIDELLRLRNLPDDWDGEGSLAPDPALIDVAIEFARQFQATNEVQPDRVHLGVNSTIYFEWFTASGYRELEVISADNAVSRFFKNGSLETQISVNS